MAQLFHITWSQMGVNSFFNPNYTEDEVWDLLTQYLEKKHHVNTSTIQRGIYADINRDGSILTLEDQEYEYATLFCYRNFNFNISGSIIYQLDPPLNDEFDLEAICQFLNEPFPKSLVEPELTPEQIAEKAENLRLLKIKKSNEDQANFEKTKLRNIAIAALYCLEYNRATLQDNIAYHYGQINKTIDKANYFIKQGIRNNFNAMVIPSTPPSVKEYIEFLNTHKELAEQHNVDFDELFNYAKMKISKELNSIIPHDVRKSGSLILPLRNIDEALVSAVIIPDIPQANDEFNLIKNEQYTGGAIYELEDKDGLPESYFLTCSINDADAIKTALPSATVLTTLTVNNTIKCLEEIQIKNPDALIVIVVDNEYTKIKNSRHFKGFGSSELCIVAQHLTNNLKSSSNIGLIMVQGLDDSDELGELEEPSVCISMADVLNKFGEEKLKQVLDKEITELTYRRGNNDLELNYLLQIHAEAHEEIYSSLEITIPPLVQLEEISDDINGIGTQIPLVNSKAMNTVLFQESRAEFKKWINSPISEEVAEQEKLFAEVISKFAKHAKSISRDEEKQILNSTSDGDVEDLF